MGLVLSTSQPNIYTLIDVLYTFLFFSFLSLHRRTASAFPVVHCDLPYLQPAPLHNVTTNHYCRAFIRLLRSACSTGMCTFGNGVSYYSPTTRTRTKSEAEATHHDAQRCFFFLFSFERAPPAPLPSFVWLIYLKNSPWEKKRFTEGRREE